MTDAQATRRDPRQSLYRRLIRASIALTGVILLFAATFKFDALYDLEAAARDFDARVWAPVASDTIVLVTITDDDYDSLFGGHSPLNPDTVGRLVRAAATAGSRVIGVDLETSDPAFARLLPLADSLRRAGQRVVWAQDALVCAPNERASTTRVACSAQLPDPLGVLGVSDSAARAAGTTSGLVVIQLDPKGTVRHYRRHLPTTKGERASFVAALGEAYGSTHARSSTDTTVRFVGFHRGLSAGWELSAAQFLALVASPDRGRAVLAGKALVLGGDYRAGRDTHHTPLGMMSGVEIHAQALETEMRGGGPGVPSHQAMALLQFFAGAAIILLPLSLAPRRALFALLVAISVMSLICSWALTGSPIAGIWYFLPLFLLLVIHHLYEQVNGYRERLLHEVYHQARGETVKEEPLGPLIDRVDAVVGSVTTNVLGQIRRAGRRWQSPQPAEEGSAPHPALTASRTGAPDTTSGDATPTTTDPVVPLPSVTDIARRPSA